MLRLLLAACSVVVVTWVVALILLGPRLGAAVFVCVIFLLALLFRGRL